MTVRKAIRDDFDPSQWRVVMEADLNPDDGPDPFYFRDASATTDPGLTLEAWSDSGDGCAHCGTKRLRWVTVAESDSGEQVVIGQVCAGRVNFEDRAAMARSDYQRAAKAAAKLAKLKAERDQWNADHPDAAMVLDAYEEHHGEAFFDDGHHDQDEFLANMVRVRRLYASLSAAQEAATLNAVVWIDARVVRTEEDEARQASIPPMEEGRRELTGTIRTMKWQDSDFGGSLKMLIELEDGNRLWGTVPRSIDWAEAGDVATFTAAVQVSDDDDHFGFFSRPTKASLVGECAQCGKPLNDHADREVSAACVASVDQEGAPKASTMEGAK